MWHTGGPSWTRRLLVLSVLALFLMSLPGVAHAQPAAGETYADPDGRFTVPVPTGWRAEPGGGYVTLTDPEGAIRVYVVVADAEDASTGVAAAWQLVDPAFALGVVETSAPPSAPGVDETVAVTYDTSRDRIVIALGQRQGGTVYALLFDAETAAAARRGSQLGIIQSGFTITGLPQVDLSTVTPARFTPEMATELEAYIRAIMPRHAIPGAAVAVVQDGQVVYLNGFGVREQGGNGPVTPDTPMMIGSTGKTMTTLMMGTVVDDGLMRWDEPVQEILPSFRVADPELSRQLTVQNLVCACTGVPRRDFELIFNSDELTAENIIESLASFTFFTGFGEAFQYSNQMVGTGGYIAALAAGGHYGDLAQDYATQMQRRVFDPIGMPNTTFSFDRIRQQGGYATPHGLSLDRGYVPIPLSDEEMLSPIAPAGASWSTARDMARYLITQLNRGVTPEGRRVVSEENLLRTWTPQVPVSAGSSYGLGWFVDRYHGARLLHHGGNTIGFTSDLAFLPDAGVGIVVITNARASNAFNEAVRFRLLELLYDQPATHDATAAYQAEQFAKSLEDQRRGLSDTLDEDAVLPYLGRFSSPELGTITITLRDGALWLDVGAWTSALKQHVNDRGDVRYLAVDPPSEGLPFEFTTDDGGRPVIVLDAPPDRYTFTRLK
jgi:CubicO group peptidase (beta-lactamase class C family)